MNYTTTEIWIIIAGLGFGSWLLRFSFMGIIGSKTLPEWILRHLRYTAVAIMPGLVAPLVLFPQATGGQPDPARLIAALAALGVGYWTKNVLAAITAGAIGLYGSLNLLG